MNVANYLVEICGLKFRITLPSRRSVESWPKTSSRLFALAHWNGRDEPKEYVFLCEDIIAAVLPLINNFEAKENFLVRYLCHIYGHDKNLLYKFYVDAQRRVYDNSKMLADGLVVPDRSQVLIAPEIDSLCGLPEKTTFRHVFLKQRDDEQQPTPSSLLENQEVATNKMMSVAEKKSAQQSSAAAAAHLAQQPTPEITAQLEKATTSVEIYKSKTKLLQDKKVRKEKSKLWNTEVSKKKKKVMVVAKKPKSILKPSKSSTQSSSLVSCESISSFTEELPREDSLKPILAQLQGFNRAHDIGSMLDYIKDHLLLKRADHQQRQELVARIEKLLNDNELRCKLTTFGSTKNGLGLKTSSDIDIFVRLINRREHPIDEMLLSYSKIRKQLEKMGKIIDQGGRSLLPVEVDSKDGGVCKADNLSVEVICHQHMRVPLVRIKFFKSPTTTAAADVEQILQCDLNVNNALGIANTKLIKFLCRFEPRFMILNVLLRFWAKEVAQLNRPDALSSYALTNMILYYFQRGCRPVILPAVNYFVLLSDDRLPKIVNDWRCDFCTDVNKIDWRTKNEQSPLALMVGFFEFWANFEFDKWKISTRHGKTWQLKARNRNTNGGNIPAIHIMDPFEQSHNLTSRIKRKYFARFCESMKVAIDTYKRYL